jgi:hypothetical protein
VPTLELQPERAELDVAAKRIVRLTLYRLANDSWPKLDEGMKRLNRWKQEEKMPSRGVCCGSLMFGLGATFGS